MKNYLIEDKKAKSKSFFFRNENTIFNKKFITFLESNYLKYKKDIRICMHKKSSDKHHDMIILQQRKNFYLPHKHLKKGETYHIIKGKMICVLFYNNGKIKSKCVISKNNIFRTPLNTFHTMAPLTKYVIYHESKMGPFLKKDDSIFPPWVNKFKKSKKEILKFKKNLEYNLKK